MSLVTASDVVQLLAPFLALGGAILLYFKKRDDDLKSSEASRRTELSSRFVSRIVASRMNAAKGLPISHESSEHLDSAHFEIRVGCPKEVVSAANVVSDTVQNIWMDAPIETSAAMRNVDFFRQLDDFVDAARSDLASLRPRKLRMHVKANIDQKAKKP